MTRSSTRSINWAFVNIKLKDLNDFLRILNELPLTLDVEPVRSCFLVGGFTNVS